MSAASDGQATEPTTDPLADSGADPDAIAVLEAEHRELRELFDRVSSPDEDRPAVLQQLLRKLAAHLAMEKQMVLPVLRDRVADGNTAADRMTEQHDQMEKILTLVERRKVNSPDVPGLVTDLLDSTDEHISAAETTIEPGLRSALSASELQELGSRMVSEERQDLSHAHPNLPNTGPIAGVTRKVAEVVDNLRDRSTDVNRTST
jgi:hypothetical protein